MSTPQRRRSTSHIADNIHGHGRPSWLFPVPKPRKQYTIVKLFCWSKQEKKRALIGSDIVPLLEAHAQLYQKAHNCQEAGCQTIKINVAGQIYETQLKTLRRFPTTLLGSAAKREKYWDVERQEYFFDRHRPSFDAILNFYQNGGILRRPMEVQDDIFQNEIKFFQLGEDVIKQYRQDEGYLEEMIPEMPDGSCMRFFWQLFSGTHSSILARCIGLWSMFVTVLSVGMVCVETLPKYHARGCDESVVSDSAMVGELATLFLIETMCVLWFCIELGIRLCTDPDKKNFFKKLINITDAVTIFPYPGTVIEWHHYRLCLAKNITQYMFLFRILKFIRVVRVFKLCRHIQGLRILLMTIKKSTAELSLYVCFVIAMVVMFASGIYFAEISNHGPKFTSIPEAFWWAVVSLTTVGYGDYVPQSTSGKLVGTMCITTGILVVALPVPVLVANFTKHYRHQTGKLLM
ncbi:potassium voltage-gated channel subfamily A member 2-like [Lineus longissimus]|uniref:potassium voltage-gated channel subfamily A member 2-like n=1 Tax=Lineus longissimus TaxID=88925 RepID=UPI002B4D68DF